MKTLIFALAILLGSIGTRTSKETKVYRVLPQYTTLNAVDLYTGKGKVGEILIPSFSRKLKSSDREKTLRDIMKAEGWVIISAFSTKSAYTERSCEPYSKRTKAFKDGFLGKVDENGNFSE